MLKTQSTEATFSPELTSNVRIAIVRADYHAELNISLEKKCVETLMHYGVPQEHIETFVVPGSWEIPLLAQKAAKSGKFDAIVAFGLIVKGDTYHFEMLANECARALMQLSIDYSIPVTNEVLAVYNLDQAMGRTDNNEYNRGIEAATAVLKTLEVLRA